MVQAILSQHDESKYRWQLFIGRRPPDPGPLEDVSFLGFARRGVMLPQRYPS